MLWTNPLAYFVGISVKTEKVLWDWHQLVVGEEAVDGLDVGCSTFIAVDDLGPSYNTFWGM